VRGELSAWCPPSCPRKSLSGNLKYSSFRGSGAAREPGTQEHRPAPPLRMAGVHRFRAWSCGPSRNDGEVGARQGHFLTASKAGIQSLPLALGARFRGGDGEEKSPRLARDPHLEQRCHRECGPRSSDIAIRTRKTAPHPVPLPASGAREMIAQRGSDESMTTSALPASGVGVRSGNSTFWNRGLWRAVSS
jgi:hypothetical protein